MTDANAFAPLPATGVSRPPAKAAFTRVQYQPASTRVSYASKIHHLLAAALIAAMPGSAAAANDARILVELPAMMQQHMLSNMRDHLAAIDEILKYLADGDLENAAETAEYRLGMSSLESHGASHMARFMPEGMRRAGTAMHRAASRFALKAQEGEVLPAYRALADITAACVACHAGYRVK